MNVRWPKRVRSHNATRRGLLCRCQHRSLLNHDGHCNSRLFKLSRPRGIEFPRIFHFPLCVRRTVRSTIANVVAGSLHAISENFNPNSQTCVPRRLQSTRRFSSTRTTRGPTTSPKRHARCEEATSFATASEGKAGQMLDSKSKKYKKARHSMLCLSGASGLTVGSMKLVCKAMRPIV